jgi:anti-sigma factor RsiW
VKERPSAGEIHAYVDNCLSPEERARFEVRLSDDEELRRSVEFWQAQNESIRAVFGAPARPRAPNLGGPSNENARTALPASRARLEGFEAAGVLRAVKSEDDSSRRAVGAIRRPALWAAVFCAALALFPSGGPLDFRGALIDKGVAAYRAFATPPSPPLDFVTGDADALLRALGPRFRAFDLAGRLPEVGWTLLGARIAPGIYGAAAFALVENTGGRRIGLLIEPLDAPPSSPPHTTQRAGLFAAALTTGGFGLAIIGPADADSPAKPAN